MKLALIGKKLSHSYSQEIHEIFFELTGIEGSYRLLEVSGPEKLEDALLNLEESGFSGTNITIPYKIDVLSHAVYRSPEVIRLNAANTIAFTKSGRKAYNTDYFGFMRSVEKAGINPGAGGWLVLGSGGGASSVKAVLEDMGAPVIYTASTSKKGEGFLSYSELEGIKGISGVVNTTPVGMFPDTEGCILPEKAFKGLKYAVDLVYNPSRTKFLQYARDNGCVSVNGLYMLVAQAVKAQEIWNNKTFGDEIIDAIYSEMEKRI
ncbi:MAG: shikimate dehydrogenase [Clostridia bacterium]|nr:shikimate dehydrogenase [Clostridia bacterium]